MAKPKAQTIQQRFGFADTDLKSPTHDEMMIWLDNHAETIIKNLFGWADHWDAKQVANLANIANRLMAERINTEQAQLQKRQAAGEKMMGVNWYQQDIEDVQQNLTALNTWPGIGNGPEKLFRIDKRWEHAIKQGQFIIGFIDMLVIFFQEHPYLENVEYGGAGKPVEIIRNFRERGLPTLAKETREITVFFEVKTTIPSLGELIRQINMYRVYSNGRYYIVSADDRFIDPLKSQGIGFVKYPSGDISQPQGDR